MSQLYFAYGMNTNVEQMAHRCPAAISLGAAELPDYELVFRGCADIQPTLGSCMEGVLWNITDECLAALDVLEGYPNMYDRYEVEVFHDNEYKTALVYKMNASDIFPPSAGYLRMLFEGYSVHGADVRQIYRAVDQAEAHYALIEARYGQDNSYVKFA